MQRRQLLQDLRLKYSVWKTFNYENSFGSFSSDMWFIVVLKLGVWKDEFGVKLLALDEPTYER